MGAMKDYMREYNEAVQPVLDAIDTAMRTGKVDPEALGETISGHLEWWAEEMLAARPGEDA